MRYFWCWLFPPLGMLTCNRPGLAFVAFVMCCTLVLWLPAAIWSYIIAAEYYANERNAKLIGALRDSRRPRSRRREEDDEEPAPRTDNPFDFS